MTSQQDMGDFDYLDSIVEIGEGRSRIPSAFISCECGATIYTYLEKNEKGVTDRFVWQHGRDERAILVWGYGEQYEDPKEKMEEYRQWLDVMHEDLLPQRRRKSGVIENEPT